MSDNVAADQLRLFVERLERLIEERKGISSDISDVYTEAKSQGFDKATIRECIKLRATARDNYLASAKNVTASNMALLEQLYGVDLSWGPNGYNTPVAANDAQTGLAPTYAPQPVTTTPINQSRATRYR